METRRSFLQKCVIWTSGFIGLTSVLSACSNNDAAPAYGNSFGQVNGGDCLGNGTVPEIELLHVPNHTVTIPKADVAAGVAMTYTLADNGSGHTHQITLAASDFSQLQVNQGIMVVSTFNGHQHRVVVNCA